MTEESDHDSSPVVAPFLEPKFGRAIERQGRRTHARAQLPPSSDELSDEADQYGDIPYSPEKTRDLDSTIEELLCDAALRGDLKLLQTIIEKDIDILDKVLVRCFKGKNPLHLAISTGKAEFVQALLKIQPKLAEVVDTELGVALHLASANGDSEIVEALLKCSPEMCMACDRDGYNPLHIAAMKGNIEALIKLVQTCPLAAQVILDRGDTILHLCVNYNQLRSLQVLLEMTIDPSFVRSTDANGNTILHVAVLRKRLEIVEDLLMSAEINVNAINEAGWTAKDVFSFRQNMPFKGEVDKEGDDRIEKLLHAAGAIGSKQIMMVTLSPRRRKLMQTVMIVATLFATIAFQVGVNPPGGVWVDDSQEHQAGKAILAYKYPKSYSCFMYFNTVGFLVSLAPILILLMIGAPLPKAALGWIYPVMPLLAIMTAAFTYTYSVIAVSPKHMIMPVVTYIILVSVTVWAFLMLLFAVVLVSNQELLRPKPDRVRDRLTKLGVKPRSLGTAGDNEPGPSSVKKEGKFERVMILLADLINGTQSSALPVSHKG